MTQSIAMNQPTCSRGGELRKLLYYSQEIRESAVFLVPPAGWGWAYNFINKLQALALSFGHILEPRGPNFPIPFMPLDPLLPLLAAPGFRRSLEVDIFLTLVLSSSFPFLWPCIWEMITITVLFFFKVKHVNIALCHHFADLTQTL